MARRGTRESRVADRLSLSAGCRSDGRGIRLPSVRRTSPTASPGCISAAWYFFHITSRHSFGLSASRPEKNSCGLSRNASTLSEKASDVAPSADDGWVVASTSGRCSFGVARRALLRACAPLGSRHRVGCKHLQGEAEAPGGEGGRSTLGSRRLAASEPGRGVAHLRSKVGALIAKNSGFLRKPTWVVVRRGRGGRWEGRRGRDGQQLQGPEGLHKQSTRRESDGQLKGASGRNKAQYQMGEQRIGQAPAGAQGMGGGEVKAPAWGRGRLLPRRTARPIRRPTSGRCGRTRR